MTPKEYLSQYQQLNREIDRLLEEKARWMALALRVTPSLSEEPKGGGGDRLQLAVEKIMEVEEEIDAQIDQLVNLRREIEEKLSALPDSKQKEVLHRRYILGQTLEQIAEEMGISRQWTNELHGRGLQKISTTC